MYQIARVIVDVPMEQPLDYRAGMEVPVGSLCVVPVGQRRQIGIVVGHAATSMLEESRLRPLGEVMPAPRVATSWLELCKFCGRVLPLSVGRGSFAGAAAAAAQPAQGAQEAGQVAPRRRRRSAGSSASPLALLHDAEDPAAEPGGRRASQAAAAAPAAGPALRAEQSAAIDRIVAAQGFAPFLLFGITGSGKTEVYLGAIERILARAAQVGERAQALLLVPEINLTPQLQARLRERFPGQRVLSLHSGLAPRERADAWMQAHLGHAQIILGTRTAVFASLPQLRADRRRRGARRLAQGPWRRAVFGPRPGGQARAA